MSSLSHEMFFGETLCVLYVHNLEAMQIYTFSAYMEKLWLNIYMVQLSTFTLIITCSFGKCNTLQIKHKKFVLTGLCVVDFFFSCLR